MLVDVSLHKFADRGNKFTVGDTNDLQLQIKKLVESERRGTIGTASDSSHSCTSARCRDRGGGIHIHVPVVRGSITRVQFPEDSTTGEWNVP